MALQQNVGKELRGIRAAVVLGLAMVGAGWLASGQEPQRETKTNAGPRPVFAGPDAVHVMEELRQALESNSRSRFLKLFDGRRMPGYAAFRDQVAEFFAKYDSFQVQYHLTQVAMHGEFGAVVADVGIDAAPGDGVTPNVRSNAPVRLVVAWDGKQWKVVDLWPRSLFR
jgi:hypothetical protein